MNLKLYGFYSGWLQKSAQGPIIGRILAAAKKYGPAAAGKSWEAAKKYGPAAAGKSWEAVKKYGPVVAGLGVGTKLGDALGEKGPERALHLPPPTEEEIENAKTMLSPEAIEAQTVAKVNSAQDDAKAKEEKAKKEMWDQRLLATLKPLLATLKPYAPEAIGAVGGATLGAGGSMLADVARKKKISGNRAALLGILGAALGGATPRAYKAIKSRIPEIQTKFSARYE